MFTSVFGISIKYEAWNHQDSLPVHIVGWGVLHTIYRIQTPHTVCSPRQQWHLLRLRKTKCKK